MEKHTLTTEELNNFLLEIIHNKGGLRRKLVALKQFLQKHKIINTINE
jgi:histidinol phosphatase-like enzyme